MARSRSAVVVIAVGVLLALLSLFADTLGVGGQPGFGWKQSIGLAVGLGLVTFGLWPRR